MSTLAQDFNVGAVQGGHYQRMDVTLTWDSDIPMEFRLHVWQPTPDGEGVTVITALSRDLLVEVAAKDTEKPWHAGNAVVSATRVRASVVGFDSVYLHLMDDGVPMTLTFQTGPLASLLFASLAKCPLEGCGRPERPDESEALDVDGLIHQIFNAEEAS